MRNHVSAVLPNAFDSRIAISGLMPDLPLTTLFSVCRVTPRTSAPSVMDRPRGSRQAFRMLRPGCGGFFIGMVLLLVIVDQFYVKCIPALKAEDDPPVRPDGHRPELPQVAFQRMQTITRRYIACSVSASSSRASMSSTA